MALRQDEHIALEVVVADVEQMQQFSSSLAPLLQPGDVVLLYGDLGAGKTTFVQCLAKELGIGEDQYVSSPSFALMHEYFGKITVRHMDLYRLTGIDDVEAAGLLEYFGSQSLCIIEWPDRLEDEIPTVFLQISLVALEDGQRKITIEGHGKRWVDRLTGFLQ